VNTIHLQQRLLDSGASAIGAALYAREDASSAHPLVLFAFPNAELQQDQRTNKNGKLYFGCDPCGTQFFIRGKQDTQKLK
jgi:hypothetical protein